MPTETYPLRWALNYKTMKKTSKYYKKWRQWCLNNQDKMRAYRNKWKENNPHKIKEEYESNKERYIEKARIWRLNNPEKYAKIRRKSWKKWYNKQKEINPEYVKFINNRHHERMKTVDGSHTFKEWEDMKEKFNYVCQMCGKEEPEIKLTKDHIIPITKHGSNYITNIQPLCGSCNSKKHNKIYEIA